MLSRVYYIEGLNAGLNDYVRANLSDLALDVPFEIMSSPSGRGDTLLCSVSQDGDDVADTFLSMDTTGMSPVEFTRQLNKLLALDASPEPPELYEPMTLPSRKLDMCGAAMEEAVPEEKSLGIFHRKKISSPHVESSYCGNASSLAPEPDVREQFLAELQRRLQNLSDEGVNIFLQTLGNDFLKSIQDLSPKPLSPLCIDEHYRILLPDYALDIKMNALWRAIYILFIRHEEGIVLKDMWAYRDELARIYKRIASGEYERMEATIDDVTMPGSDNFRQYLSKINRAFTDALTVDLAQHYIISGTRGGAYSIRLPRDRFSLCPKLQELA